MTTQPTDQTNDQPRTADTTGSSLPAAQDYSIAPEDQHIADRIANFDPIADVPSPTTVIGGSHKPITGDLKASMLPPEAQDEIRQKLRDVPLNQSAKRESDLVRQYLTDKALELRIKAGPGEGATEFQKVRLGNASKRHNAQREIVRLHEQLAEVDAWVPILDEVTGKPVIDPKTGQPQVKAIETVTGERRTAIERRIAELNYQIDLIDGPESDLAERKAIWQDVQNAKARQAEIEIDREARAKADAIVRQERIDAKAEAHARGKRYSL